jgi:hypothetical protein
MILNKRDKNLKRWRNKTEFREIKKNLQIHKARERVLKRQFKIHLVMKISLLKRDSELWSKKLSKEFSPSISKKMISKLIQRFSQKLMHFWMKQWMRFFWSRAI